MTTGHELAVTKTEWLSGHTVGLGLVSDRSREAISHTFFCAQYLYEHLPVTFSFQEMSFARSGLLNVSVSSCNLSSVLFL